jgi:hypothetical protein
MTLIINIYNVIRSFNNICNPIRSGRAFLRMEIGSGSMSGTAQTYQDKGFFEEDIYYIYSLSPLY